MTTSTMLALCLNLAGTTATEYQQTAVAPKSAIQIVIDLNERLKTERAIHQRDEALNLRVGPGSSKAELDTYRLRIGNIEKKRQEHTTVMADFEGISKRLSDALMRIDKAPEAEKAARTTDALNAFDKEGLKQLLQRVQGRPQKEVIEAMNQIIVLLKNEIATAYKLDAELSEMLSQQKEQLANCQRAADREEAAQRKLGRLNLAIFALDGALRLMGANPSAK